MLALFRGRANVPARFANPSAAYASPLEGPMAILDSATGKLIRDYSIEELIDAAKLMRGYDLVALCAAGSGHAGGTLSIMDVTAALYLKIANHDPGNPLWSERDRIIWSGGHKAPSLYLGLAFAGFCKLQDVMLLRKLGSPFQGHPHWLKLPGVEVSTGSLGQGLSIAVGVALAGKLNDKNYRTFCIMGDGEQQEGEIWEAAMEAAHYKLENLVGIVDFNRLQIDGPVSEVMNIDPLEEKYASFGWDVVRINGHDMAQILNTLSANRAGAGKPLLVVAETVKGKGVSFMENVAGWHGKAPNHEEMIQGLRDLGLLDRILPAGGVGRAVVEILCRPALAAGQHAVDLIRLPAMLLMWCAMALAMMIPSAAPMIMTYADIAETAWRKGERVASPLVLTGGYVSVWIAFAVAAAGLQWALARAALLDRGMATASGLLSGAVFVLAGAYQFSGLKHACVTLCRAPFAFFFANWTPTSDGVFRLGVRQGLYCLGCCWAMMLVMFAVGVMNVVWMAALGVLMTLEKVATTMRFSRAIGVAFIAIGVAFVASSIVAHWPAAAP